ncbi:kinase-like domain-containing protein [Podospora didyma]|uniref:Kinase-like domain-containing protein n=1 Tax=Podospora didyma TaxID=330526 RepID=A0AAE0N2B0_9PEZI|nr:kinase-like domain-containing protein [Podospora didyma]
MPTFSWSSRQVASANYRTKTSSKIIPANPHPYSIKMCQALDYLVNKNIVHRDVKPENILYTPLPNGTYKYQLADFGLAHKDDTDGGCAGTSIYMAPEILKYRGKKQTTKADVWPLFITVAFVLDINNFRLKVQKSPLNILAAREAASLPEFVDIKDMAIEEPENRVSAGTCWTGSMAGNGRTTRRGRLARRITSSMDLDPPQVVAAQPPPSPME